MKRSPELSPLSHDHHQALFVAQRLKRADDEAAALDALRDYWREHGARHFRIEEEILLPGWVEGDATAERAMAARVVAEHLEIRAALRRLETGGPAGVALRELGGQLERHVRFEERELFPRIEAGLDAAAIAVLGEEIERAEASGEPG